MPGARTTSPTTPNFPLEILHKIIDNVDHGCSLRDTACSNTSLLAASQQKLFNEVVIGDRQRSNDRARTGSSFSLLQTFNANPHLSSYVHHLVIEGQEVLNDLDLPLLLSHFHNLITLTLCIRTDLAAHPVVRWDMLHRDTSDALMNLARTNHLEQVSLQNIRLISHEFLDALPSIQALHLIHSSFDCDEDDDMPCEVPAKTALRRLVIEQYRAEEFQDCITALKWAGFDLSVLEDFRYRNTKLRHGTYGDDQKCLQSVLDEASPSLRKFTYKPDRRVYMEDFLSVPEAIFQRFPNMKSLSHLEEFNVEFWHGQDSLDGVHEEKSFHPIIWLAMCLLTFTPSNGAPSLRQINVDLHTTSLLSDRGYGCWPNEFEHLMKAITTMVPRLETMSWLINYLAQPISKTWDSDPQLFEIFGRQLRERLAGLAECGKLRIEPNAGLTSYYNAFDGSCRSDIYHY